MGRSATSLIAQALHKYGVHMGDNLFMKGAGNPLGHYEDRDFMELNKKILRKCGGSAANLPSEELIKACSEFDDDAKEMVESKDDKSLWGWKDPRTVATIEKYVDHLEDPILICPFRNPEMVAKSLHERDGISIEEGLEMAKEYNRRVLKYLEEHYT